MKTKSHLKLRALCEGAIMVALAYVLSFIKLFELPQGGSIDIGMLPIFLYCARWGFGPGLLASFVYSFLQLLQGGGFVPQEPLRLLLRRSCRRSCPFPEPLHHRRNPLGRVHA